jgi:hypothetical protein
MISDLVQSINLVLAIVKYPVVMVGGTIWPVLEFQPLNHLEHATQNIAEATALLELDSTKRAKLPAPSLNAFLNNVVSLAKEIGEQPSGQEILGKLNSLQPIVEDATLSKNVVNNALAAVIIQMRTGKIGLRHYLYQRGVPDMPATSLVGIVSVTYLRCSVGWEGPQYVRVRSYHARCRLLFPLQAGILCTALVRYWKL